MRLVTALSVILLLTSTLFAQGPVDPLSTELLDVVKLGEPPEKPFNSKRFYELLSQGANVNAQDISGHSVLFLTVISHAYLADAHIDKAPLLAAIKALVDHGANVNLADKLGLTPLMHAVHRAHTGAGNHPVPQIKPVYDILLSATNPRPDLDLKNFAGQTALMYLAKWAEDDELRRFISLGADIMVRDSQGKTIFFEASQSRDGAKLLNDLLNLISDEDKDKVVRLANNANSTPLIGAVRNGNIEVINLLLDKYKVDVNAINNGDESALSIALLKVKLPRASEKDKILFNKIAQILRDHGADTPVAVDPSVVYCDRNNIEPFGFEKIKKTIEKCGIKKLDDLIPLFPKTALSNYILSYKTRGVQKGTESHPRVISMGRDGRVMLSFIGDSTLSGFNTLEMIEFKEATNTSPARFEMHDISFAGETPHLSQANPPMCLNCHGANPRPRWDNWYLWPGMYESEQGAMYPIEKTFYAKYLENRNKGRYKNLLAPSDSPTMLTDGIQDYNNTLKNVKMDFVVQDLTTEMIISEVVNNKRLQKFKYAILGALSCQDSVDSFLKSEDIQTLPRKFDEILVETKSLDVEEFKLRVQRQSQNIPGGPEGDYTLDFISGIQKTGQSYETERMARLRYIIEGIGEKMDWTNTFEKDKSRYAQHGIALLELKLWKHWIDSYNPNEADLFKIYNDQHNKLSSQLSAVGLFRGQDFQQVLPGVDSKPLCNLLVKLSQSQK